MEPLSFLEWVLVAVAASVVTYFGKHLAVRVLALLGKREPTQKPHAEAHGLPKPPAHPPQPDFNYEAEKQKLKLEKKKLKLEKKRAKD